MGRTTLLRATLQAIVEQRGDDAVSLALAHRDAHGSAALSLASFALTLQSNFDRAMLVSFEARAMAATEGSSEVAFAAAATTFVVAACGERALDFTCDLVLEPVLAIGVSDPYTAFIRYLALEGVLGSGRLDLVPLILPETSPYDFWADHDYGALVVICAARAAAFSGQIDHAHELLLQYRGSDSGMSGAVVRAAKALVAGNAGDAIALRTQVGETTALINASSLQPEGYLGTGLYLLLAYGLVALGDRLGAAHAILAGGGDAALSKMVLVDRGIGLEMLVAAALEREDADAARAWLSQARELRDFRAAAPAVARAESRIALAEGDSTRAAHHAQLALTLASAESRVVEQQEAQILLSQSLIAAGNVTYATQILQAAVVASDTTGHKAFRQSASRALRSGGRRLKPIFNGGWDALTARERQVAEMLIAGVETDAIAATLVLSPATVRVHVSRVLAAFGVASRIGLVAAQNAVPDPVRQLPELTARQGEVITLIALGQTNTEISATLGISPKSVESHVGEIRRRLEAQSRFALARIWWAAQS